MKRTQWFKDGDHPAVQRPKEAHLQPVPGMKNCGIIYSPLNPDGALVREGDWIVENDDGTIWIQRGDTKGPAGDHGQVGWMGGEFDR